MTDHSVDVSRWERLTIFEQMGNVGAEVGRAFGALRRKDELSLRGAFYRGLDLLDLTACCWAQRKPRRAREILRAREIFVEAVMSGKDDPGLEAYFMRFAVAARLRR